MRMIRFVFMSVCTWNCLQNYIIFDLDLREEEGVTCNVTFIGHLRTLIRFMTHWCVIMLLTQRHNTSKMYSNPFGKYDKPALAFINTLVPFHSFSLVRSQDWAGGLQPYLLPSPAKFMFSLLPACSLSSSINFD